ASAVTDTQLGWTGSTASCTAGTISSLAQSRTLARINYFRKLAGLNNVTFDPALESRCQQAALMMAANNQLSHTPPASWQCYTAEGAAAAGNSNLALGAHSASAITLYMNDNGVSSAGHRRWILYSRASVFGHGSAMKSDALQVFNTTTGPSNTNNIPWPSAGFFPAPLVPLQWSFSKSGADFSSSTVQMTGPSGSLSITQASIQNGYGDNTIVWTPAGIVTNSTYDVTYNVQVNNVKISGVPQTITYSVTICQPSHPPQCPSGKTWSETECGCMTATGITDNLPPASAINVINPFSEKLEIRIPVDSPGEAELSVLSYTGRLVLRQQLCLDSGESLFIIDSSAWHKGIYVISLIMSDGRVLSRVVIKE
ncbi:MAG: CAP domain-containing protein, partial [Bacteroidales bacterium]|nr:CAP domain-containing protein [Bacteroidales bacterium]